MKNWRLVGHLIYSLFEIASRTRLSVCIPDIHSKFPVNLQNFEKFSSKMERIEEWNLLTREIFKKFGQSQSACELTAATKKTVESRRANSPYIGKILVENSRLYKYGRILPNKFGSYFILTRLFQTNFKTTLKTPLISKLRQTWRFFVNLFQKHLEILKLISAKKLIRTRISWIWIRE